MALIAGAYSRVSNTPLPDGLAANIVRAVSRRADAPREVWSNQHVVLVHCETGAYDAPAFVRDGNAAFTAIAGDPLMRGRGESPDRSRLDDTARIHAALRTNDVAIFGETTAPFAGVHYDAARHALTLVSDKLGYRALYYWVSDALVVFASSMHAMQAIDAVPKHMNLRGVLQLAPIGYVPGNGTPYANVRLVGAGEAMRFEAGTDSVRRYWRLDHVRTSTQPLHVLADDAMAALQRAVTRRLGSDRTSVAFLTGGMDTRLVVCELLRRDVRVHTLNGAFPGNQDQIYARLFADAIGARHQEMPGYITDRQYPARMAQRWYESPERAEMPAEHPQQIWAGIGGSVALGGVAIDEPMIAALRRGDLRDGVARFVAWDRLGLPQRVLTSATRARYADVIEQGFLAEYRSYETDDPARFPWLLVILNEYRRAYAGNLEDVDLHGCEQLLPLCDTDLLEVLGSVPVEWLLGHQFYMQLVVRSDPRFLAAPWQTYDGHAPCPVPAPADVPSQWDTRQIEARAAAVQHGLNRRVLRAIFSRDFPATLVGRARVFSAAALMMLGLRDTRHVLQFVDTLHQFVRACGGRIIWSVMSAISLFERA